MEEEEEYIYFQPPLQMDAGDRYRASTSGSTRAKSSSIWGNTGMEAFSGSSGNEDDEEALKWAALQKLPTFDRLKKGLLFGSRGANEVGIEDLGYEDKRKLVERLFNNVQDDNEQFLLKYRNRLDRYLLCLRYLISEVFDWNNV